LAAEFLQQKASGSNLEINKGLSASSSPEVIKDTLFSYNGRSSKYAEQAKALGFDKQTQPYEGSPYVMNKADALRDPEVNTTSWGQVKVDFGPIEYPANDGYGAYVIFASIAGIANGCGSSDLIWPYSDRVSITSCYGPRTHPKTGIRGFHKGVDMSAGEGTPIRAAAAGTVVKAGQARGYGANFVVIEHGNGFGTSYGHMGAMTVKEGDRVNQGQKIGTEGNEGISTGSHLHFNLFPGKYAGNDSANLNPLQNGFSIPEGTINAPKCS
jgi:murein DD-endopeptidase MepM/ murein hydrolase activator NlpD